MADELFADRYRLEHRLGVGGMSTVQLAFDTRLERYVAVKLLAEHLAEDASFVARFRREALAAARLVHPNVVQVFDFGLDEETNRNFIVMEHVDGQSCAEILKEHGVARPARRRRHPQQACQGLDYAHRNGVVHRDVKPGNLLRSHEGVVKLADFGIAKAAEDSEITKAGSVLGTAAYLSPEQARGEKAGPPADLYALGVVSYQLLTGRLPYEAASLTDLARMQESGPPPSPSDIDPDIPPALGEAVMRALHPLPEGRYEGALRWATRSDGLRGIAPEPTDATLALDSDLGDADARRHRRHARRDRHLSRPAQRTRRPLEPIDEPPRRRSRPAAPPRRRPRAAPAPRASAATRCAASRCSCCCCVVVAGVLAYQAVQDNANRAVQLREDVRGNVQDAVDEIKGLIQDNTSLTGLTRWAERPGSRPSAHERPTAPRRARRRDRLAEPAPGDRVPQRRHQHLQVGEVVDRQEPRGGRLAALQQVVQVGAGVAARAGRARAALEDRLVGVAVAALGEVDAPACAGVGDDRHAVAADAGRHRAVERVDPSSTPRRRSSMSPIPSRWRGRSSGSSSTAQPTTSYICALSSPSEPPIAIPPASRAATSWAEARRRSSSTPPWTIP